MRRIAFLLLAISLLSAPGCSILEETFRGMVVGELGEYNTAYPESERRSRTTSAMDGF